MNLGIEYEQLCGTCSRDRYLEHVHHGKCELCDITTLVGLTRRVAERILLGPVYD